MELCLVRHAIAVQRGDPRYEDDALRPLTARGRARMESAAAGLRTLFTPQVILTSPLVRAQQTAEVLLLAYGMSHARVCQALATGDNQQLQADLDDLEAERIMLVGHEPHISTTLSWLLVGSSAQARTTFRKGAAALVSCEGEASRGACTLEWLIQPGVLRAIAGN